MAVTVSLAGCTTSAESEVADTTTASASVTSPEPPTSEAATTPGSSEAPANHAGATSGPSTSTTGAPELATSTTSEPSTNSTSVPEVGLLACAGSVPLRDRIALLVWPAVYSSDWGTAVATVTEHQVGGVVLMEPSGWDRDDLRDSLAVLDGAAGRGLVVATDEEGGAVQRLALLGELPSQQAVSEQLDPTEATRVIADHAESVADVGVDLVLGPVVDIVPVDGNVPLTRSRFFTGGPNEVAAYAGAYIAGWGSAGLVSVLKHFPGHGGASGDTHDEQGMTASLDELAAWDLIPYRELAGTSSAVMVGHLTVPGLTDGVPATQSSAAVGYLRGELGYGDALVMTDALGMQAVGLPEDEASVRAIAAGIDVVIFTNTARTGAVINALERAVAAGTVSEDRVTESAARVLRLDPERSGCALSP